MISTASRSPDHHGEGAQHLCHGGLFRVRPQRYGGAGCLPTDQGAAGQICCREPWCRRKRGQLWPQPHSHRRGGGGVRHLHPRGLYCAGASVGGRLLQDAQIHWTARRARDGRSTITPRRVLFGGLYRHAHRRVPGERTDILHDVGRSLNPILDKGQVEGAFIQGMGWLTTEELWWDDAGRLRTHAPSTYKIPLASDRPRTFNVDLADWSENREMTIKRSKAVGEPPSCWGSRCWRRCRCGGLGCRLSRVPAS